MRPGPLGLMMWTPGTRLMVSPRTHGASMTAISSSFLTHCIATSGCRAPIQCVNDCNIGCYALRQKKVDPDAQSLTLRVNGPLSLGSRKALSPLWSSTSALFNIVGRCPVRVYCRQASHSSWLIKVYAELTAEDTDWTKWISSNLKTLCSGNNPV